MPPARRDGRYRRAKLSGEKRPGFPGRPAQGKVRHMRDESTDFLKSLMPWKNLDVVAEEHEQVHRKGERPVEHRMLEGLETAAEDDMADLGDH